MNGTANTIKNEADERMPNHGQDKGQSQSQDQGQGKGQSQGQSQGQKTMKIQRRKVASSSHQSSSPHNLLNQAQKLKKTRIHEIKKKRRDFVRRINYVHLLTVVILPFLALSYILYSGESILPANQKTMYFTIIYYNITMLAFTSGYHKYFAHNSFKVKFGALKYFFAVFGSSCGLGSIRWWASLHRAHHRFTEDTERDPYSIKRGFIFSHYGWLLKKPKVTTFYDNFISQEFPLSDQRTDEELKHLEYTLQNEVAEMGNNDHDTSDEVSREDYDESTQSLLAWQQRTYPIWFLTTTLLIPIIITKFLCHDSMVHGLLYPGILRMFLCQQSLLSTESICHLKRIQVTIPTQPFNDKNSSQNCLNPLVALLTYGQSQQNFHHEFPHDYRCDNGFFTYDPTKWFIWTMEKLGIVHELCRTPDNLVVHLNLQQQQRVINRTKSQLNWGTPISKLPLISPKDFKNIIASSSNKDRIYIVIQSIIHDITPFMDQHPGGVPLLKASHGKDATKAFYGGVYGHSTAAINLLATMRIGILNNGNDEEVWKRVVKEEGEVEDESGSRTGQAQYRTAEAA
ncbi:stearoyl-CoA desaturase [Lodderomyces elongisporus]|uniref:stearoyl-CoA desaturase n=1 Tax=Lodderomyces elongisporus TaxID=36914 RepID=UPI0029203B6F|nr:stearoyl-CoA desaturase [Lodderomyces elongisporus]WLF79534.1 stearoyl-CoA desaturase [Lodderomyces elongisporus]